MNLTKMTVSTCLVCVCTLLMTGEVVGSETKPIKIPLPGKMSMVFVPCPAGSYTMKYGFNDLQLPKREVTITRPFYMLEAPVTIGQFKAIHGRRAPWKMIDNPEAIKKRPESVKLNDAFWKKFEQVMGGDDSAIGRIRPDEFKMFFEKLSARYKYVLPTGYVFRLPTNVEWEYALRAGGSADNGPFTCVADGIKADCTGYTFDDSSMYVPERFKSALKFPCNIRYWEMPRGRVKTAKPNAWGLYDMLGLCHEMMADTMPPLPTGVDTWTGKGRELLKFALMADANSVDPFLYYSGKNPRHVTRIKSKSGDLRVGQGDLADTLKYFSYDTGFRVVIGPDLVAEQQKNK